MYKVTGLEELNIAIIFLYKNINFVFFSTKSISSLLLVIYIYIFVFIQLSFKRITYFKWFLCFLTSRYLSSLLSNHCLLGVINAERTLHTGQLKNLFIIMIINTYVDHFFPNLSDSALLYFERFHETIHS